MAAEQPPPPPLAEPVPSPSRRVRLAALLPYLATAGAAILCSLLLQALIWPRSPVAPIVALSPTPLASTPTAAPPSASPTAPAADAPSPAPTRQTDAGVLRLELLDLEEQDRQLWSALYLLRAALQIDDALIALQGNDIAEADRTLITVYRSLDRAYDFSAEQEKGPIDTFRLQLSQIRDDLRVRPEGADRRLRQLRRLVLSLVDEGG